MSLLEHFHFPRFHLLYDFGRTMSALPMRPNSNFRSPSPVYFLKQYRGVGKITPRGGINRLLHGKRVQSGFLSIGPPKPEVSRAPLFIRDIRRSSTGTALRLRSVLRRFPEMTRIDLSSCFRLTEIFCPAKPTMANRNKFDNWSDL